MFGLVFVSFDNLQYPWRFVKKNHVTECMASQVVGTGRI
uniref:Uncharacterized protein n=1 Tax=Arundo donax TaxID=35708 RepID=A0A0A8ZG35_ARUDO